jgi:integrase
MAAPRKYPQELRDRAVWLALESDRPLAQIAADLGIHREALRTWVRQAQADASKRWVQLPPFLAEPYEGLLEQTEQPYVFVGGQGGRLRRGQFARRFWLPAWDGDPEHFDPGECRPPVLRGFTFHEGRHTRRTWLVGDGVPDVARAAGLGHNLPGMADVYEHASPLMKEQVLQALHQRWETSLHALRADERDRLITAVPQMDAAIGKPRARQQARASGETIVARTGLGPRSSPT